jgi:hypothetical protein
MISDWRLDHLHDQRDWLENTIDTLRRAQALATRFERDDKAAAIERQIDAYTRDLMRVEDEIDGMGMV